MRALRSIAAMLLAALLATAAPAQQTVNLRDADIRAFIEDVSRATGRTFIIDPRVQGKVSVVSEQPLGRTAYFELFLATLRANGLIATPVAGGAFRIQPVDGAASQSGAGSGRDRFITEVFKLNAIDSTSAVETLRPLVSREGQVTASRGGNAVIVVDYADNIARVRRLLGEIDRDRQTTKVIPLKNAGAREIAGSLTQLLNAGGQGADGARSAVSVVAIDSSNAVALRGDPVAVARLAETVQDLDRRAAAGADVRVLFLAHADAEKLLPVLQQLVGQTPTPTTPQQGLGGGGTNGNTLQSLTQNNNGGLQPAAAAVSSAAPAGIIPGATIGRGQAVIARFEGANAIVIAAPADVQRQLGEVIRQLDTRREQVLVEAIIVEISDLAAKKLGVQFLLAGQDGSSIPFAASNYSNASPNLLTVAGAVAANKKDPDSDTAKALTDAALKTIIGTTGGIFGFGGAIGNEALFSFVINALKTDTASNVLSTPSIMTLDNQQARILVGQNVPITTGEVLSSNFDNPFRTVDRQDIGVQLDVRPQINAGGTIKLTLRQEVSSIAGPQSTAARELIINKREITTTVTVDDGQIIALGGLIDDVETESIEKVPLLGDIPGLGVLFRSKSRSKTKTNLMVFIRPSIIKSAADAQAIAADRYNYMRAAGMANSNDPNAISAMDELVRDYFRSTPPVNPYVPPAVVPPVPVPPQ